MARVGPLMSVSANNDEPLVRIAEDDFAKAVSLRAILAASLPSIVNNAAQPLAAALQLGLLGHSDSAAQRVAVFSAVGAAVTFVANISNFVIVVTMSRVGHALGAKRWAALGRTVWTVLVCALVIGLLSALVLWLGRRPLLSALSLSRPPLDELAESYLPVALLRLPPLLLLRASSAVLVGYQRVKAASLLNLALACADTAAFYLLLHSSLVLAGGGLVRLAAAVATPPARCPGCVQDVRRRLVAVGAAVAATCAIAAAAAVTAVLLLPPDAAVRVLPRRCCRRAEAAPEAEGALPADTPAAPSESSVLSLARDSLNVLLRPAPPLLRSAPPLGDGQPRAIWCNLRCTAAGARPVGAPLGLRARADGRRRAARRRRRRGARRGAAAVDGHFVRRRRQLASRWAGGRAAQDASLTRPSRRRLRRRGDDGGLAAAGRGRGASHEAAHRDAAPARARALRMRKRRTLNERGTVMKRLIEES